MKIWITRANNFSQINLIKNKLILDIHLLPQSLTHNRYIELCQMKEKEIRTEILNHLVMNRNVTKKNLGGVIKSMLRRKQVALNAFIRNPKKNQTRMKQIQKYRRFHESGK